MCDCNPIAGKPMDWPTESGWWWVRLHPSMPPKPFDIKLSENGKVIVFYDDGERCLLERGAALVPNPKFIRIIEPDFGE